MIFQEYQSLFILEKNKGKEAKEDGESWLRFHFEGFPAIATLTKYTSIQNDLQMIEKQILTAFINRELQIIQ